MVYQELKEIYGMGEFDNDEAIQVEDNQGKTLL